MLAGGSSVRGGQRLLAKLQYSLATTTLHHFSSSGESLVMTEQTKALVSGILNGQRDSLAKAITLVESTREDHKQQAVLLMNSLVKAKSRSHRSTSFSLGNTLRLGVAGPPGAGKSTFIENLGMRFIEKKHRVAVVPVDPSSHIR
jgi:LAO/AO transport system kinase